MTYPLFAGPPSEPTPPAPPADEPSTRLARVFRELFTTEELITLTADAMQHKAECWDVINEALAVALGESADADRAAAPPHLPDGR